MKNIRLTALSVALLAAFGAPGAMAQSNEELLKELKALRARVEELEKKVAAKPAAQAPAPAEPKWGMTPEQVQDFNRIAVKTEAIEDQLESQGYKGLKVSGYIEPAFVYNQRQERAGFQFLNQQADGYAYDTSYIGSASIDFTKEVEGGTIWKLTLTPNRGVGAAIDGASIVQEATVAIPLSSLQTRLVVGQIPDWSGYEYQQPTLNPFTSHNLLYDFTLPVGYTGIGISHTQGKWWLRGAIANVNSTIRGPGEKAPALVYRVDYSKGEFDGWGLAGLHGKTANFNYENKRTMAHLFEVDGYYLRGDWALQGQVSFGTQKEGAITPDAEGNFRDSRWWGVSGLAGYMFTPRLQGLVRADYINNKANGGGLFGYNGYSYFDDEAGEMVFGNDGRNGIGPDLAGDLNRGANRYAVTVGMKYAYDLSTTFKLEYRLDGADRAVFEDLNDGTYKKNNSMVAASVVVAF
ncbi:MAG TPA: DUF3138 family protein [Ideonella sp.]|uniref:DUF3138 family protein n=1 Tax=Ideonella sp. TaxID=1929293 RepID=UPI002E359CAB|nr:DUF3138 family protein [Ideonella sp.]HEX5688254.1 DUF3138 family protein [Ideonella sp.]